jgi:hypothetical protein
LRDNDHELTDKIINVDTHEVHGRNIYHSAIITGDRAKISFFDAMQDTELSITLFKKVIVEEPLEDSQYKHYNMAHFFIAASYYRKAVMDYRTAWNSRYRLPAIEVEQHINKARFWINVAKKHNDDAQCSLTGSLLK